MKSTPESSDPPLNLPAKQAPEQKPDTYTETSPGVFKNNRTGMRETRFPLKPAQSCHPVFDEQCED